MLNLQPKREKLIVMIQTIVLVNNVLFSSRSLQNGYLLLLFAFLVDQVKLLLDDSPEPELMTKSTET